MADPKSKSEAPFPLLSIDGWAAIAALAFILLVVIATLPRLSW